MESQPPYSNKPNQVHPTLPLLSQAHSNIAEVSLIPLVMALPPSHGRSSLHCPLPIRHRAHYPAPSPGHGGSTPLQRTVEEGKMMTDGFKIFYAYGDLCVLGYELK